MDQNKDHKGIERFLVDVCVGPPLPSPPHLLGSPLTLTNTHGIMVSAPPKLSFSTFRETDDELTAVMTQQLQQQESRLAENVTTRESILSDIRRATYREIHRIVASEHGDWLQIR
jgi:hypothetical protein